MRQPSLEELSLVVRALHQDVSALADRLRKLEAIVDELREAPLVHEGIDLALLEGT
jgi:prefoldin subunit 5